MRIKLYPLIEIDKDKESINIILMLLLKYFLYGKMFESVDRINTKETMKDEKITIIEGPTPTFELVNDIWANGIIEGPTLANVAVTRLRTFNGEALVERCYKAWNSREPINLEFRDSSGLTMEVPIIAARSADENDGQLLLLWVRLPEDEVDYEFTFQDAENFLDDEEDFDDLDFEDDDDLDEDDFEEDDLGPFDLSA